MSEKVEGEYGAEQIQVLDGLEHIRKRPGMYISSTDAKGLHHLVHEVVDNSIDEALAGYCTHIEVVLNADGSCTVSDNGRGIPTDIHPKEGISTLEVVFTKVNAGGKFGGDSGYKVSSGLHGVGVKAVNALSEWLEAEVFQNGHVYKQVYNAAVGGGGRGFGQDGHAGDLYARRRNFRDHRIQLRRAQGAFAGAGLPQ